jgi:hypothetical protein
MPWMSGDAGPGSDVREPSSNSIAATHSGAGGRCRTIAVKMGVTLELAADEEWASRPFSAPAWTDREARIMQGMLERLRVQARRWPTDGTGFLLNEPDSDGHRNWIRVPDCAALLGARELTVVGFFGRAREDVDQSPIHQLEAGIVDTLETVSGVLCYYDLALAEGGYGNLILCSTPDAPTNVRGHSLHRHAVELTPGHYHCVRLHTGAVPGRFNGDARLVVERTRYYDFDSDPPWLAVRKLV